MEGIPEEDLRAHEKRLAGKDKDEPDSTDTTKVPQPPHWYATNATIRYDA